MASNQLQKIIKAKIWKFFGGIKPKEMKDTSESRIEDLGLPSIICLPIDRHLGKEGEILVNVGDHVKKGQPLTKASGRLVPVHASTSGTINAISKEVLPHPSGYTGLCITIKPDGNDECVDLDPMPDWELKSNKELLDRIHNYGVEGLGGAQFQTDFKIKSALDDSQTGCNVLIINGAECEPVITCDDRIMQEQASDIALGIQILKKILNPKITVVAIEDNKPQAISAMKSACEGIAEIRVIPTKYPSGAARNLIKIITGIEIPYSVHTSECGIVVNNVGTVLSVKEAVVDGMPVISRVVTVAGESMKKTGNVRVRLGSSVRFVLSSYNLSPEFHQRIILGGPMMGFTLPTIDVPITKSANCILAPTTAEIPLLKQPQNCIRCGRCARVCPSRLVPYQMYNQSKAKNHAACLKAGITDCTLCGACAYVCPSFIPLTSQFRYEQAVEKHIRDAERRNLVAKQRMKLKEERLEAEAKERQAKKEAALARIKAQKEAEANMSPEELAAARAKALEEAKAKARERKEAILAQKQQQQKEGSDDASAIKRLKESQDKAIAIARHQGHIEKPAPEVPETTIEQQVANAQLEEKDILPQVLKKNASGRLEELKVILHEAPTVQAHELKLVGLPPDDSRQNPEPKKVIPQVLMSAQEEKKEINILPEIFRKKTLRSKR
ncbi:electron transport complex subunit RsxC [uncultured Succinivibrio sp.]|uniref:electron transport complex subunit RsxC n=1 Tax=uncultured Succinivibrio sp. TaxID=540749 RepID=UPI0025F8CF8E|nr:electron transport complex subunit RsxC [uncultured Succinivibrio sp.]